MRVLVTGCEGQVARSLIERVAGAPEIDLVAAGRPQLELGRAGSAAETVRRLSPDVVISAAAYTAVDQAEDEPDIAYRVNGEAPGELAAAAREAGARIIHLSTDYVFDGAGAGAYAEDSVPNALGVYGKSKLLGEQRVREATADHVVIRTSWVYSPFGRNFLKTMVGLARAREEVSVVADQRGCPTSALDIADGLLAILRRWEGAQHTGLGEIFHLAGTGTASWCEFAEHIFRECARLGLPTATVQPIPTSAYPTRAVRPANSVLDSSKFSETFGYRSPPWRSSATTVIERLAAELA